MVGAGISCDQPAEGSQDGGDRSPPQREDGPHGQGDNSLEGWVGECYRKVHEKRLRRRWESKHSRLLSGSRALVSNMNRQESLFCASTIALSHRPNPSENGRSRAKASSPKSAPGALAAADPPDVVEGVNLGPAAVGTLACRWPLPLRCRSKIAWISGSSHFRWRWGGEIGCGVRAFGRTCRRGRRGRRQSRAPPKGRSCPGAWARGACRR
jgi:hypothetical protein